jgi:hypothetical protein
MQKDNNAHERLTKIVGELLHFVERTADDYSGNARVGVRTHAIPFFGDVLVAEAITVGVNPSADEFRPGRWPNTMTAEALTARLLDYFRTPSPPPHPRFDKWSGVLAPLGYPSRGLTTLHQKSVPLPEGVEHESNKDAVDGPGADAEFAPGSAIKSRRDVVF